MANITEILGTDSVSSSRPVINSNFELLNDELATVTGLLDPTTAVLSGLTNATTQELNVVNGSTLFRVSTSGALIGTAATFSSSASFGGSIVKGVFRSLLALRLLSARCHPDCGLITPNRVHRTHLSGLASNKNVTECGTGSSQVLLGRKQWLI